MPVHALPPTQGAQRLALPLSQHEAPQVPACAPVLRQLRTTHDRARVERVRLLHSLRSRSALALHRMSARGSKRDGFEAFRLAVALAAKGLGKLALLPLELLQVPHRVGFDDLVNLGAVFGHPLGEDFRTRGAPLGSDLRLHVLPHDVKRGIVDVRQHFIIAFCAALLRAAAARRRSSRRSFARPDSKPPLLGLLLVQASHCLIDMLEHLRFNFTARHEAQPAGILARALDRLREPSSSALCSRGDVPAGALALRGHSAAPFLALQLGRFDLCSNGLQARAPLPPLVGFELFSGLRKLSAGERGHRGKSADKGDRDQ